MQLDMLNIKYQFSKKEAGKCNLFEVGCKVYVTSFGPFRGLRGTILRVDSIATGLEEPFCFYLIALEGAHIPEPIWFDYNEVELITAPAIAPQGNSTK